MTDLLSKLALYLRTVRWLRVSQLGWLVYRRLRPVTNPRPVAAEAARQHIAKTAFIRGPQPQRAELRFLNVAADADPATLDWHPRDKSRLWRYNLHYFDYLLWDVIPADHKPAYIESWLQHNPVGCEDAWEPYTVSLRIVNWCKYFTSLPDIPAHWLDSLLNQANWLRHNLERHILANHYFKNAKALLFAGVCFDGPVGAELLRIGTRLVSAETREQILGDGGHYERSPMYHCITLEDMLDIVNLMQRRHELFAADDQRQAEDAARRMLRFLDDIVSADGRIPLFNDSAFGIAPEPAALFDYGSRLVGYEPRPVARQPLRVACRDSGYFGYRYGGDSLLIDCGHIGPEYQPGHTHCDMLSFELCIDGERLLVDPGVHGYDDDSTRYYLRSTAAHNTVTVDGAEQSEIWSTFRVARRASPLGPELSQLDGDRLHFSGGHDGFRRLPQRATHRRRIDAELAGHWEVYDTVDGEGEALIESWLHLAPDIEVVPADPGVMELRRRGRTVARLRYAADCDADLREGYVAREFGLREAAPVVLLQRKGRLPLAVGYSIERAVQPAPLT